MLKNSWVAFGVFGLTAVARPFQFVEVEDPGVFSATANRETWVHWGSGTQLLLGFQLLMVYTNRRLDPAERQNICEILEHTGSCIIF